ncbi:MAG: methyltransferase [Planctomycetota bacterium]
MERSSPAKILGQGAAMWEAQALLAGVRLGVFAALEDGPRTAAQLARRCNCSRAGLTALAEALAAHDYLRFRGGRYANSALAARYLLPGKPAYLGDMVLHQGQLVDRWSRLHEAVRKGRPVGPPRRRTPESAAAFTRAMASNSGLNAPAVARLVSLRGARTLLDLGGGPGIHSLHFCRANPRLEATVFDFPETLRETRKILAPHPEFERITLYPGDVLRTRFPGRFDVVWLSHLIHSMSEREVRRLLARAVRALNPGGRIVIHDFFRNEGRPGPRFAALFRLNMLVGTPGGRTYSRAELKRWLQSLGLARFTARPVPPQGVSGLLLAR